MIVKRPVFVARCLAGTALTIIWSSYALAKTAGSIESPSSERTADSTTAPSVKLARATAPDAPSGASVGRATTQPGTQLQEIVVTAQKRSERLNAVPLTITAASAQTLQNIGVTDASDLGKLVPGFTFAKTGQDTPVYTLRGVGYYDSALAATPAVTVYVDQTPLTYPQMTRNATFDLERVEVLKGPQGTLFGQNSTGGAVNYVAAKPTNTFKAGADLTAGRFGQVDGGGFVSGPVSDTIKMRIAIEHDSRGDWQESYTRPGDTRGAVDITKARMLIDWTPNSKLNVEFSGSGWVDKSDTQAAQLIGRTSNLPSSPLFTAYPLAPNNARAADWSPNFPAARDDSFYQFALRADYALTDIIKLTSISSYGYLDIDAPVDEDGTSLDIDDSINKGTISSFNQELRAEVDFSKTRVVLGGNYSKDIIHENQLDGVTDSSTALNSSLPGFPIDQIRFLANQNVRTIAVFANVDHQVTDQLSVQGGVRYTNDKRNFRGCIADVNDGFGSSISFLANDVLRPALGIPGTTTVQPNACATLDSNLNAGQAVGQLQQNNVSFRVGPSFKLTPNALLYFNISKGYKAGTFPTIGGVTAAQFTPTKQESVLDYEGGFKVGLFDRKVQINGAGFYYQYNNKQLLGTVIDPLFGPLQQLVNVPNSQLYGAELEVNASPIRGLSLSGALTYVHSEVTSNFANFNPYGDPVNFKGSSFPYTPEWQAVADAQYTHPVSETLNALIGANVTYNDATVGSFGANLPYNPSDPQHTNQFGMNPGGSIVANALDLKSFVVLDLRAGIQTADGAWKLTVWGRNITNNYYWNNATFIPADATVRFAALPATYGVTLNYRFGGH